MRTKESLQHLAKTLLNDCCFIVASNAEPYVHAGGRGMMDYTVPAGGVTSALDPIMQASGGTWIAYGGGKGDWEVVDQDGNVQVPPEHPSYTLRRVQLSVKQVQGYYDGMANGALWPLCHITHVRPRFIQEDWNTYVEVNRLFAKQVHAVVGNRKAVVFVQDYHLALLPQLLKATDHRLQTMHFWHIPWPPWEVFRIFPWGKELLEGLLGNDVLGFHLPEHCHRFLETIDRSMEAHVDYAGSEITYRGRTTTVRSFPIGVDMKEISQEGQGKALKKQMEMLKASLGVEGLLVGIGLEREDYTKGIPERLKALNQFFHKFPEYRERVVFVQIGVPSRAHLDPYHQLHRDTTRIEAEINKRYGTKKWKPIIYLRKDLSRTALLALYRLADFCIVSALHDGMNLVAKEFVATRSDEDGVLILSPFTGAARELTEAIQVNPYATERFAECIKLALEMPKEERKRRMQGMRAVVEKNNVYNWATEVLLAAVSQTSVN